MHNNMAIVQTYEVDVALELLDTGILNFQFRYTVSSIIEMKITGSGVIMFVTILMEEVLPGDT
jgi:hypothetical protein